MIIIDKEVVPDGYILKSYSQGKMQNGGYFYEWVITNGEETHVATYKFTEDEYSKFYDPSTQEQEISRLVKILKYQFEHIVDPGKFDREIEQIKKEFGLV